MWLTLPRNFFRFSYLLLVIVSKELELAMSIASVRERTDFKRSAHVSFSLILIFVFNLWIARMRKSEL